MRTTHVRGVAVAFARAVLDAARARPTTRNRRRMAQPDPTANRGKRKRLTQEELARIVLNLTRSTVFALGSLIFIPNARAAEGGATLYVLGSGGPEAAVMPPVEGLFFGDTLYYYDGNSGGSKQFVVGGNVVANLDATIIANFADLLWVPSTHVAGGTLGLGGIVPFGRPDVNVSAVLTGPLGAQLGVSRSDSAWVVGDPVLTAELGWHWGDYHLQASTLLNLPIGDYREGELANLAFHRWAGDLSLAGTWHDDHIGWDVSGKAGFTFNGTNEDTDYTSGTDFHLEAAVEKTFTPQWSGGAQAYYYHQVSGDSGSGARLGSFEGRVTGVGLTAAYHFEMGHKPTTLRFHAVSEFDASNRLEGNAAWVDLSLPLAMHMPGP